MHAFDHIFMLLIFVVWPIYSAIDTRIALARLESGQQFNRVQFCVTTSLTQWVILAVLGVAWWLLERPFEDLGFRDLAGWRLWGGTAFVLVMITSLVVSWQAVKRAGDDEQQKHRDGMGQMAHFLPHTRRELRYFFLVSLTAGIVEEIVFRGFALWYLSLFMPLWVAVVVSSVGFGIMHIYLGSTGAVRAGLLGLAFAIFYVLTDSIWLPILAHIALDILQGLLAFELLRKDDVAPTISAVDSINGDEVEDERQP